MPISPTIHRNGSSADVLFREYSAAASAVRSAIDALPNPNARDYYVAEPGAFERARAEHQARIGRLTSVRDEIYEILEQIADQRDRQVRHG